MSYALDNFRTFLLAEEPWRARARCRPDAITDPVELREHVEQFFPTRGSSQKAGKALCARCPVQTECDEYAQRTNSSYGIWGGVVRRRGPQHDTREQDAA